MLREVPRYGWRPDLPDHRDLMYKVSAPVSLPSSVDLRPNCPAVYDQGQLGSCTANAISAALEFERKKQGLPDFTPSRLFIYYNERVMEGDPEDDNGAQIRNGISSVASAGAPSEAEWPYIESQFSIKPTAGDYTDALADKALQYKRLDGTSLNQLKSCLASGAPFVFGFTVYSAFEGDSVATNGILDFPADSETVCGGHAVLCVGYEDDTEQFIVRNSWGPGWGKAGYFYMPYEYVTNKNLADDFWTISLVGG